MNEIQKSSTKQETFERDELRARFTSWLETTIFRAKLKYLRKNEQIVETIPLEDIPEGVLAWNEPAFDVAFMNRTDFDFEEERLARAYSELPLMRKEILRLLFVEEKTPTEIARLLNCSIQHVYNQRSIALKKLKRELTQEGEEIL